MPVGYKRRIHQLWICAKHVSNKSHPKEKGGVHANCTRIVSSRTGDWKLNTEILTYSRAKGAFAGLKLSGASIRRDDNSMQAFYARHVTTQAALTGKVPAPAAAHSFLARN
jgi:lipid-binding SYLF domain-containing protein